MAWFGGGSVAAGGLGVSGGAVVAIVATQVVLYGFQLWDQHEDYLRVKDTLARLNENRDFAADVPSWRNLAVPVGN
jgi:hypothetical protein